MPTPTSKSAAILEPLEVVPTDRDPGYKCANRLERLVGRSRSATRGPDCAWFGQCAQCAVLTKNQLKVVEDHPDGQFVQILRCLRCGATRACRPGWTTRCHVCMDARTSRASIDDWLELYRTIASDSEMTLGEVELEVRDYAGLGAGEPTTDQDRAEYVVDLLLAEELERRKRTGWTLLATDVYGLPWYDEPEPRGSHGTWARHDACGKVQKLDPGQGRTECRQCPPEPESRTHRARASDRYLLYLVRQGTVQKFGRGYEARVREHRNGGAEIMQVIEASHTEVVAAELALKRRYARRLRVPRRRQLPKSFGAGTEVLPASIAIDLTAILPGVDVTSRYIQR